MKRKNFRQVTSIVFLGFALMLFVKADRTSAQAQQPQLRQSVELKFEEYRRAIRNAYQIDIK
ncbi:MAG: hypothetical protein ACXWXT_10190, partial [Candidatus Binatia bacterium]